eukprot:scaffold10507_cov24-Phaeocystis_antarctica.AAC.1
MAIAAKRSLGVPGALASSLSWLQQYHSLEHDLRTFAAYLASSRHRSVEPTGGSTYTTRPRI